MKKKFLFFVALVIMLGSVVSGCYVDRGYYHPYYHYHPHRHYYYQHY